MDAREPGLMTAVPWASCLQGLTPEASSPPALLLSPLLTACQVETFSPMCPTDASELLT